MDYGNAISILVAIVAAIISLVSLKRTRTFNNRQIQFLAENEKLIQLQRQQIEQGKTASDISLFVYNTSSSQRLGIVNKGNVVVEEVNLKYIDQDGYDSPFIESEINEKIPIKRIHPDEEHNVNLALCDETPLSFEVQVSWKSNGGRDYEKKIVVTP